MTTDKLKELAVAATPGPWFVHDFADPAVSSKPSAADVTVSCDHPATITVAAMGGGLDGHEGIEQARKDAAFIAAANPSAILALIRERDEAREQVNGFRLSQSFDKDSAYVIRVLLNRHNVPAAAFIDDHVANAIAQRDAAEAALSAAQKEVERLLSAMDREEAYLHRMIDASEENGGIMHGDLEGAFHRIRDKDSDDAERAEALTKETPHG